MAKGIDTADHERPPEFPSRDPAAPLPKGAG